MITYARFQALLLDVLDCSSLEEYIAECGGSVPLDDADAVIRTLTCLWSMTRDGLTIKSIASACGLSVRQLALAIDLPLRTAENWASGVRNPPAWQLPLIAYAAMSCTIGEP